MNGRRPSCDCPVSPVNVSLDRYPSTHFPKGRQLFERNKALEEDTLLEEGTVSVDASQYERSRTGEKEDDDDEGITFSDSD
jgi:hypothetical protein